MILEIEDEEHGAEWRGYLTVKAYDDDETLIFQGHVAAEVAEELEDAYLDAVTNPSILRTLAELFEDGGPGEDFDPTMGPGGPGWPDPEDGSNL